MPTKKTNKQSNHNNEQTNRTRVDFYTLRHLERLPRLSEEEKTYDGIQVISYFSTTSAFRCKMFFITWNTVTFLIFWNKTFRSNRLWTWKTSKTMFM